MRNSFLCLVSHVREAKRLPADLAVTGINHQMMFFPQSSREVQNVDSFIVFHAGERLSAEPFLGKKIVSSSAHPIVLERIRAFVTSVLRLDAFLDNYVHLECMHLHLP